MQGIIRQAAVLLLTAAANAAPVAVENAAALYPEPEKATAVFLALPPGRKYVITDLAGKECGRGQSERSENAGFSAVRFSLPRGWYRVHFPETDSSVGLAVTPDSPRSEYWNIDAGLTWSDWTHEHQKQVIDALRRKGIASFRERMSWTREVDTDHFHGEARAIRDLLYRGDSLELFQDSPASLRLGDRTNAFFVDFARSAGEIRRMESEFKSAWNAVELWNEPFFTGAFPSDQYVPMAKLLSHALKSPVCGGSFSPAISHAYLTGCLESGFADILDALSLHFYGSPESMREVIAYYRSQLKAVGREAMPLWVTESGSPDPSLRGAVATTMRAIECRTLGVKRFYAFYLQRHQEGSIDWGLSDASGTPRPALACFLAAASLLGDKAYCGDVNIQGEVSIVHCFSDQTGNVLVLYGKPGAELTLPTAPDALAGADGREFPVSGKAFRNADGLGYAFFAPGRLDGVLKQDTVNMKYFRISGNAGQRQKPAVVLQPQYPVGQVLDHSNNGYTIAPGAAENYTAVVICNNLSGAPVSGTLSLELPDGKRLTKQLTLPADSGITAEFPADFRAALDRDGECMIRFVFTGDDCSDRIVQRFQRPATIRSERLFFTDGKKPDWAKAKVYRDTTVCGDVPGKLNVPPEEFGSEAQFLWSDIGIHFRVNVHDLCHEPASEDGSSWMHDSLQLSISQYNSANDNNRFEWGFWRDAAGIAHKTTFLTSTGQPISDKSQVVIRRDEAAHTTLYEGVIAWYDLGSMNAVYNRDRMRLRLTFCVNDDNNGNRRWSEWTPGIAKDKNPDDFVEFMLVTGDRKATRIPLTSGKYSGSAKDCIRSGEALKLNDIPDGALEFTISPVELDGPVTLKFELAATDWAKHNGTGFSFGAALRDSATTEEYAMFAAPTPVYAGTAGYMLQEKNEPAPVIGMGKKIFSPSGLFHTLELTIDSGTRKFELAVIPPKGKRELVASGPIRHNTMRSFDKIVFTTSGWGAGPFLLKNIRIIH